MNLLMILIVLGMVSTLVALGFGIGSMMHGGKYDEEHSTQLMFARVGSQGITLVLLLIALIILHT